MPFKVCREAWKGKITVQMLLIECRSGPSNELRELQHVIIRLLDVPQGHTQAAMCQSPDYPWRQYRKWDWFFITLGLFPFFIFSRKKLSCICGRRWSKDNSWEGSLLPCGSQGLNSGCQVLQPLPLPTEPSHWPLFTIFWDRNYWIAHYHMPDLLRC